MKKGILFLLLFSVQFFTACNNSQREKELDQREQDLLSKQKEFAKKEAEYQSLLKFRDSLASISDSNILQAWPDSIAGKWNAKLLCIESTCTNYVVGDQRTDQWEFDSDSTNMYTKVTSNNQLVRIYKGAFSNNHIILRFATDSSAQKQVTMEVNLNEILPGKMRGTRKITGEDKCIAVFSVELNRAIN